MELSGTIIGGLTVIKFDSYKKVGKRNRPYWQVKCECGNEFSKNQSELMSASKKNIHTVCRKCSALKAGKTPKSHGLSGHPLYNKWNDMKTRVKRDKNYEHVSVCKEWANDFVAFYNWSISNGWKDGLEIDRKNTFGNYEPSNCRYVSKYINAQNKRDYKQSGVGNIQQMDNGKFKVRVQKYNVRNTYIVESLVEAISIKKKEKDRIWEQ